MRKLAFLANALLRDDRTGAQKPLDYNGYSKGLNSVCSPVRTGGSKTGREKD
ncbi:hypothetical protein AA13594_1127 [Gluconacetobacter azotocaptans DSM 13594]|nr:hypothetical protein AA13594_1127 [Gluconacetobacter azotocaptans DSM 13594]